MLGRMAGKARVWNLVIAAYTALGVGWTALSAVPEGAELGRPAAPREGFAAPDFSLAALDGSLVRLSDFRGQVVVINFWASWCPPCRAEMPAFQRVARSSMGTGLAILGVNATAQDSPSRARDFAADLALEFPILLDDTGEVNRLYLVRALPTTILVGSDGTIDQVIVGGPVQEAVLRAALQPLLEAQR